MTDLMKNIYYQWNESVKNTHFLTNIDINQLKFIRGIYSDMQKMYKK